MRRLVACESLILRTAGTFIADKVGIGAAKSGGTNGFVGVHHNLMLGCFGDGIQIVVVEPLTVVVFAARNHISNISALDSVVAILVHELVGLVHVALIVAHRCGCLMVHHQAHTF